MLVRFKHVAYGTIGKTELPLVPRQGEQVKLSGTKYRVADVTWIIDSGEDDHVRVTLQD